MTREIDAILVPQGAEFAAVKRACQTGPPVFAIPAGPALATSLATLPTASWQRVLLLGLCGSLDDRYGIGEVVLYGATISPTGQRLECDRELREICARVLAPDPAQVLALTSPHVICRAAQKQHYREQLGAQVVDMEGQVAQTILASLGIAMGTIRVVSDDSRHDLPDLSNAFDAQGRLQTWPLARSLLGAPIAGARLVRGSLRALAVLDRVARQFAVK